MKKLLVIICIFSLVSGCKKVEVNPNVPDTPKFYITGTQNGQTLEVFAGRNNVILNPIFLDKYQYETPVYACRFDDQVSQNPLYNIILSNYEDEKIGDYKDLMETMEYPIHLGNPQLEKAAIGIEYHIDSTVYVNYLATQRTEDKIKSVTYEYYDITTGAVDTVYHHDHLYGCKATILFSCTLANRANPSETIKLDNIKAVVLFRGRY
jgi:hypothetical protein